MNASLVKTCLFIAASAAVAGPALAQSLSPAAQTIVGQVKSDTDINTVCKSESQLRDAVRSATVKLVRNGTLSGRPRADAEAAGKYIFTNCGSL